MKKKNQLLAVLTSGLLAAPMVALADYEFELVDHPGTPNTQVLGINDRGDVVGNGFFDDTDSYPFVYASKKGTLTDVAPKVGAVTSVWGISDSGVIAGIANDGVNVNEHGFIAWPE